MAIIAIALAFLPAAVVCAAEEPAPQKLDPDHARKMAKGLEVFKSDVRQVLIEACVNCHGGDKTKADLDLTTREGLLKGGVEGPSIVPGDASKSWMFKLVTHAEKPYMPQKEPKLSDAKLKKIEEWINLGAPYDKPLIEKSGPLVKKPMEVTAKDKEFWSFRPLKRVEPPVTPGDNWSRNAVDRFIIAKLKEKALTPNPIANPRVLIRRAYFDLIGLPPTPEEVEAFVKECEAERSSGFRVPGSGLNGTDTTNDNLSAPPATRNPEPGTRNDPTAYEKLIDRLLASPHHGERWARHWLDVARFGESHGFEQDYDRPHAYHYRDFVIKALNSDMPFDQFVRWQIAGDELAPNEPLALMATGFLGAGVFPTQLTEKEFESARYDELDDMAGTLGTAMLGLTIGCARCHDHKFDPLPVSDYYRFVSAFTTTIRSNVDLELNSDATKAGLAKWEAQHAPIAAELAAFEKNELPKRFEAWARNAPEKALEQPVWTVLDLEAGSKGGATFVKQSDGSYLATGKNPANDKYTFVARTTQTGITAIKLEALADKSLVKGGPGRASNGNFALSVFKVRIKPQNPEGTPASGDAQPMEVKLVNPKATFEQNNSSLSIASSIDGDRVSGWAVDPQFGKNHAAVFEFETPIGYDAEHGGTVIYIDLEFNNNTQHSIGRPRLSITTRPKPGIDGNAAAQATVELITALKKAGDVGKLAPQQREQLLAFYRTLDSEWLKISAKVSASLAARPKPQTTKVMITSEGVKPIPHHADDRGFPHFYKQTFHLNRGDVNQKKEPATLGFLQVVTNAPNGESKWIKPAPADSKLSLRRTALADWIVDTKEGAGHLLARVIVNRLWQRHFGRGIVATPNDFGHQGDRPSHPELLDYLATELVNNGWRLRPIHKLIMLSSTYMQTSDYASDKSLADAQNTLLWRQNYKRLEAEAIRDSMLAVSGQLDRTLFGPGTLDQGMKRRSIYFFIKRSQLVPIMMLFDMPEPLVSQGARPATTIAPQALLFMNNAHVRGFAQSFAKQLAASKTDEEAVTQAYLAALGRKPTEAEVKENAAFIREQIASYQAAKKANARELALADFCQVVMCLNEFVYVE